MSNTLSVYDPLFYANEALMQLEKALGMAARVYRGYDDGPSGRERGSIIDIRVPGSFTAQDAPSSAQDITATNTQITLGSWKEVKFALTDKELAWTSDRIINEHIRPAAYAIADKIDQDLCALVKGVPWYADWTAPAAVADITSIRSKLFNNKVMLADEANMHFMVSGTIEKELMDLAAFTQHQGAGDAGVAAQLSGYLGKRYGFNFFANQNAPSLTSPTIADVAGAVDFGAGYAAGIKTIHVDGITAAAALKAGDIMVVTGHTQQYVLTADATADGGGDVDVTFYGSPFVSQGGLESAVVDDQVVTFVLNGGSGATKVNSVAFHRDAFCLAMAKLPETGDGLGAKIASIQSPDGLSLRSRLFYDGSNSKVYVALDVLYGVKTLDGNKACRGRD